MILLNSKVRNIQNALSKQNVGLLNEADTRMRLINPFIFAFGWKPEDIHNEKHVFVGNKHGYIDYTLCINEVPRIVIEAKRASCDETDLTESIHQLKEYFENTTAHVGILTNGIEYWFFSFINGKPPIMDERPFARVNINSINLVRRDYFLRYLQREEFKIKLLKWHSNADHIRSSIYGLLGRVDGGDESVLAYDNFKKIFEHFDTEGESADYFYVKELFEFTKYHSRYRYTHDIPEW